MPNKGIPIGVKIEGALEMRKAQGLSRMALAKIAGVSDVTISRVEQGGHIRQKNADRILAALRGEVVPPRTNGTHKTTYAKTQPPLEMEDESLVTAFKLLLEELDKRIELRVKRALSDHAFERRREERPLVPVQSYTPPVAEPETLLPQERAVAFGFPVTAALNNWAIRYEKKFLKAYEVSGLEGPVRSALQKFAQLGEQYSGLGWKKLDPAAAHNSHVRWSRAMHEFRINRRWRILVRRDPGDKAYTITRLVHHDEIE